MPENVRLLLSRRADIYRLPIDDKAARKSAASDSPPLTLLDTSTLMMSLIRAGRITVDEADEIKHDWEQNYRFTLRFGSFAERI